MQPRDVTTGAPSKDAHAEPTGPAGTLPVGPPPGEMSKVEFATRGSIGDYIDSVLLTVRSGQHGALPALEVAYAQRIIAMGTAVDAANRRLRMMARETLEARQAEPPPPVPSPEVTPPTPAAPEPAAIDVPIPPKLIGADMDIVVQNGVPTYLRCDENGRLDLLGAPNALLDIISIPDEHGGGYLARIKAEPEVLCARADTVQGALEALGARCAEIYAEFRLWRQSSLRQMAEASRQGVPQQTVPAQEQPSVSPPPDAPPRPTPVVPPVPAPKAAVDWKYHPKSADSIATLARGVLNGSIHLAYGPEEIERDWPTLVAGLRAQGISPAMTEARVVAFYEEATKRRLTEGGREEFLTCGQLNEYDYARLQLALADLKNKGRRPAQTLRQALARNLRERLERLAPPPRK